MLVKGKDVIGLRVITLERGEKIDDVEDLIYDPTQNRVVALLVDEGGWFSDARVIPFEHVKHIGKDAVMVESDQVLKKASQMPERISHIAKDDTFLTKTKIITESGTMLGKVTDIHFDSETGDVVELEVSEGGLKDLQSGKKRVKVKDIITVGEDATIVKDITKSYFEAQERTQGATGALNKTREESEDALENVREKFSDAAKKSRDQVEVYLNQISGFTQSKDFDRNLDQSGRRLRKTLTKTKKQIEDLTDEALNRSDEFVKDPQTKEKINAVQATLQQVKDRVSSTVSEASGSFKATTSKIQAEQLENRKKQALGQYLTKNILLPNDQFLAQRGDMVTHKLLIMAESVDMLDQVLDNVSSEPIKVFKNEEVEFLP